MEDIQATPDGIAIRFNFALDPAAAVDPENYELEMWNYEWQPQYGSPFYSVLEPGRKGKDKLEVATVRIDRDGRGVVLHVPTLKPCNQLRVKMRIKDRDGEPFTEKFHQTIHHMPGK